MSTESSELSRDLTELLSELRITLPGVQFLLAFLLTVPFDNRFEKLVPRDRHVFGASLVSAAFACAFLVTPSVYHRLHWRRAVWDKDRMLHIFNLLAIVGSVFLVVAVNGSVFVVLDFIYGLRIAAPIGGALASVSLFLWYGLALVRRSREPDATDRHSDRR